MATHWIILHRCCSTLKNVIPLELKHLAFCLSQSHWRCETSLTFIKKLSEVPKGILGGHRQRWKSAPTIMTYVQIGSLVPDSALPDSPGPHPLLQNFLLYENVEGVEHGKGFRTSSVEQCVCWSWSNYKTIHFIAKVMVFKTKFNQVNLPQTKPYMSSRCKSLICICLLM